ncbi:MAG: TetR/AcrR family transcriptional regulator [bacterium]
MGVKERREREKRQRIDLILKSAQKVFYKKGFQNATIEDIANAAELAPGTLYRYFRSKEEIYVSLLFESMEHFTREIRKIKKRNVSPAEKIRATWDYFFRFYKKEPELFKIIMFLNNENLKSSLSEETIAQINRVSGDNFESFAEIIRESMHEEIYAKENAADVAMTLWSIFLGIVHFSETRTNLGLKETLPALQEKAFCIIKSGLCAIPKSR